MDPQPTVTDRSRGPDAEVSDRAQARRGKGPGGKGGKAQAQQQRSRRGAAQATRQVLQGGVMIDVEGAMDEITKVPAATIHRTAAFAWASRAIAGYRVCASKVAVQEGLSYLYLGEHYREAALAHAAMGEAWQPLFAEIDEAMSEDRARAFASMRGRSPVATR